MTQLAGTFIKFFVRDLFIIQHYSYRCRCSFNLLFKKIYNRFILRIFYFRIIKIF